MLAYCLTVRARWRLVSSQRNDSRIQEGGLITELRQTFKHKILLQNVITKEGRFLEIEVSLKKLNSTAIWVFVLFYSLVIVRITIPVSWSLQVCVCGNVVIIYVWSLQEAHWWSYHNMCLHSSLEAYQLILGQILWPIKTVLLLHEFMSWITTSLSNVLSDSESI